MTLNPCSCGEVYLPKGDRYSPDNGLRVRVITSDTYYDDTLLHNVDVLVSDEQLFLTVAPRTRSSVSVYAQAIILYLGSKFTVSPTIKNSIQIVIRVKETKQILINRTIGILGDSYKFIRNPLVSNNFALSFNQNDILNTVDLNGKTLQFEIYSLCDNYTASCCEKLPTSMYLYNTLNINCPTTTTRIPTTSTTTTSPPVTTTPQPVTTTTTTTTSTTTTTTTKTPIPTYNNCTEACGSPDGTVFTTYVTGGEFGGEYIPNTINWYGQCGINCLTGEPCSGSLVFLDKTNSPMPCDCCL